MEYVNGVLNYTGSKFKLLDQILPELDYTKKYFVDLFTGSFVVGANVIDKYEKILANDIISELVGIHKGLIESDDFIERTKKLCPSKTNQEEFLKLRESFNEEKTPEKLCALILSCNSNLMRFNKSYLFNQTWGKRTWNSSTDKKVEEFINHRRPHKDKIKFISKHFNEVDIKKPSMIYIDPPYSRIQDDSGNIMNEQISEAGYNCYFSKQDDVDLYKYVTNLNKNNNSFY